jgi:hypothetical protein
MRVVPLTQVAVLFAPTTFVDASIDLRWKLQDSVVNSPFTDSATRRATT